MTKLQKILGLMSGTSLDGVDVALLETDGKSTVKPGPGVFLPYPKALIEKIRFIMDQLQVSKGDIKAFQTEIKQLEEQLSSIYIKAIQLFFKSYPHHDKIDLIGVHGQTVYHNPAQKITMQLANGQLIADHFKITTVNDFRANDVKNGGQGAPLIPVFVKAIAEQAWQFGDLSKKPAVFLNIGGVANITYVPPKGELIAFDTGPGNGLMDDWVQIKSGNPYDLDGQLAQKGFYSKELLDHYLEDDFFKRPIPKSLDRLHFDLPPEDAVSLVCGAATLCELTARSIAMAQNLLPERANSWFVSGGGLHNKTLIKRIKSLLPDASIYSINELKVGKAAFNSDLLEAHGFAYLASRAAQQLPISFPMTTAVPSLQTGGVVHKPF